MKPDENDAFQNRLGQLSFPELQSHTADPGNSGERDRRIQHKKILTALQSSSEGAEVFAEIYRREVLPIQTRTIRLIGRKGPARITHTLLGYEVQASYKRVQCPDMVTARYIKLFSELGCRSIRLPYDPTITARLIPRLEAVLELINSGVRQLFPGDARLQLYVLRKIYEILRNSL
jgi:hypothetical protein